jgi:hypothetical protein
MLPVHSVFVVGSDGMVNLDSGFGLRLVQYLCDTGQLSSVGSRNDSDANSGGTILQVNLLRRTFKEVSKFIRSSMMTTLNARFFNKAVFFFKRSLKIEEGTKLEGTTKPKLQSGERNCRDIFRGYCYR